jgi:hypothetical protein
MPLALGDVNGGMHCREQEDRPHSRYRSQEMTMAEIALILAVSIIAVTMIGAAGISQLIEEFIH